MAQVAQYPDAHPHDIVPGLAVQAADETDAAGVVLKTGIIKAGLLHQAFLRRVDKPVPGSRLK
jgi:hypothetical protein